MLDAYRVSSYRGSAGKLLNPLVGDVKWLAPVGNRLRLDVDAGCRVFAQLAIVAAVIRNSNGELLGAKTQKIRWTESVASAELEVIRFGMNFCISLGFSNIDIYSDSLVAVMKILNCEEDLSIEGNIISDIKSSLRSPCFLSIQHMRRSANTVAQSSC